MFSAPTASLSSAKTASLLSGRFSAALLRGTLCNILVCTAVWMAMAARDAAGKVLALYLPVAAFVLCGFEHSAANMFFLPAGLFAAARYGLSPEGLTWSAALFKNLLPVPAGNLLGGAGLGSLFYAIYLRRGRDG